MIAVGVIRGYLQACGGRGRAAPKKPAKWRCRARRRGRNRMLGARDKRNLDFAICDSFPKNAEIPVPKKYSAINAEWNGAVKIIRRRTADDG